MLPATLGSHWWPATVSMGHSGMYIPGMKPVGYWNGSACGGSIQACVSVISYRESHEIPEVIMKFVTRILSGGVGHSTSPTWKEGAEPLFRPRCSDTTKGWSWKEDFPPAATVHFCEGKHLFLETQLQWQKGEEGGKSWLSQSTGASCPCLVAPCCAGEAGWQLGVQPLSFETASPPAEAQCALGWQ